MASTEIQSQPKLVPRYNNPQLNNRHKMSSWTSVLFNWKQQVLQQQQEELKRVIKKTTKKLIRRCRNNKLGYPGSIQNSIVKKHASIYRTGKGRRGLFLWLYGGRSSLSGPYIVRQIGSGNQCRKTREWLNWSTRFIRVDNNNKKKIDVRYWKCNW